MADYRELAVYLPILAVALDLALGDPRWLPHPVRWIGSLAEVLESFSRARFGSSRLKLAGVLAALTLITVAMLAVCLLTSFGAIGFFISLYLCASGLALRGLIAETTAVHRLLEAGQLTEAQVALSMLVSRDTHSMSESEVRRSLAETISENLNDGFTAPLFWLCLGGPVAMWGYKTVSTLDSMWGYKTDQYKDFGWFAARADDVLAYVPARITAFAMLLVGIALRLDVWKGMRSFVSDARKMESPNAGWPMAAGAWLCGAQMGGLTRYHGKWKHKPILGPEGSLWNERSYCSLRSLVFWSGMFLALLGQGMLLWLAR